MRWVTTDDPAAGRRLVACPECGQRSIRGPADVCPACRGAATPDDVAVPAIALPFPHVAAAMAVPSATRRCSAVFVLGVTALLAGWAAPYSAPVVALACLVVAATLGHRPVPVLDRRLRQVGVGMALVLLAVYAVGVVAAVVAARA